MLASVSKVWNAKFARWSDTEAKQGELDHIDIDSIVMEKLLDVIYTGKTQVENRAELLEMAKMAAISGTRSIAVCMQRLALGCENAPFLKVLE